MLKILIVDDFKVDRENLRSILGSIDEMEIDIIGECEDGLEALDFINDNRPDIVISDIEMPFMNGLELAKNINLKYPGVKIIFCTLYDEFEYARKALYLNSYGYILKPIDKSELVRSLKTIEEDLDSELLQLREKEEIQGILESSKPQLADAFLESLIHGTGPGASEIWKKSEYFGIKLEAGFYSLIYIEIDEFEQIAERMKLEQSQFLSIKITEKLKEVAAKEGQDPLLRLDDAHFAMIVSASASEKVYSKATNYTNKIIYEFDNTDISLTISVSDSTRNIEDLKTCFQQCQYILRYKFSLGNGKVLTSRDIPSGDGTCDIDLNTLQKDIRFLLNSGSKQEIEEYIDNLLSVKTGIAGEKQLKNLCFSVVMCTRFVLNENNESLNQVFNDETLIWEKLLRFETILDARNWIVNLITFAREHLSKKADSKYKPVVEQIKKYIAENYMKNIGLDNVAEELHLTPNYLNYMFKQDTGETIADYILKQKMEKAKELLADVRNKVYEISEMIGFSNTAYFCSVFKKHVGTTPREYRERFLS